MNKLKNVFQRSSKIKTLEDRRPQQFVKRHSIVTPMTTPTLLQPPEINLSDLSEMEKQAYESWWKDLDPFDLQKINNETILKFLNGCSLQDNKLEQILTLFESAGDGLNKLQFLAMLRLIAHAQNGRKISRALVYLGAPIPQFHTNAIDALIKTDLPQRSFIKNNSPPKDEEELPNIETNYNAAATNRKSWWGNEKEEIVDYNNRRSYIGPFTAHTPIPNGSFNDMIDYFYPTPQQTWLSPNSTPNLITTTATSRPNITSSITTPITPIHHVNNNNNTHSRSKSAGNASDFIQTFHNPYQESEQLQSSRSSLSLNELNTGQSLLLTQKFVYQSPSIRHQEETNNPFNNLKQEEEIVSPFDDENSDDLLPLPSVNSKPNSLNILPPPVPSQLNKPQFPKYTRTNTFLLKPSKHQRHKSTSAAGNIFY